ncbi:MAG TPA: hypothetical protein VJ853_01565 [Thermoanaerobaculia bacterium]|nr:hypothetical protein [Thermoanaerobaculia bacterium]
MRVFAASLLLLACCANHQPSSHTSAATTAAHANELHATVTVEQQAPYGAYLTDDTGRTLYVFSADNRVAGRSACDLKCAAEWPPFMYEGDFKANGGASPSMLGKIKRPDGSTQITYNRWPLYYDKDDRRPSQIHGENATAFGGRWLLISPQGAPIGK